MAKNGKKSIIINVNRPAAIEACINYAEAKSKGLRVNFDYGFSQGLRINVFGPRDKIMQFEHTVRDFIENDLEDLLNGRINEDDLLDEEDDFLDEEEDEEYLENDNEKNKVKIFKKAIEDDEEEVEDDDIIIEEEEFDDEDDELPPLKIYKRSSQGK